jgi:hypothetical protein
MCDANVTERRGQRIDATVLRIGSRTALSLYETFVTKRSVALLFNRHIARRRLYLNRDSAKTE